MQPIKKIIVAAVSLNNTPLDWNGNASRIKEAVAEAVEAKATVICLPELCVSGYGCEDMFLAPETHEKAMSIVMEQIAPLSVDCIISVGLPVYHKGAVFNCAAVLVNGALLGLTAKQNLAGDGIHYEPRWFKAWQPGVRDVTDSGVPIGDLHYNIGGVTLGFEICEDAWVATRPGARLSEFGVDIILNPSASHFAFGKTDTRDRFISEGSRAFACGYVYANLCGNEAGRVVYDGEAIIAACGEIVTRGQRFHLKNHQVTTAALDIELIRTRKAGSASRHTTLGETPLQVTNLAFQYPSVYTSPKTNPDKAPWELVHRKEEEFTRAIAMALHDYRAKSKTQGFVVSLSGGADSAALVCLIKYMTKIYGIAPEGILTTVYQATRNSSPTTKQAAAIMAAATGAKHHEVDVDKIATDYVSMVEKSIGRRLTWGQDDITLQNIQARTRGPVAWLFANIENKLLLATSNRSEAAVGYATMDGDTCGALSPISGIDKEFLLTWLAWARDKGPHGLGPIPELVCITKQAPTAELRPEDNGEKQTDEKDLMPYGVLNTIEIAAIRDKKAPIDIFRALVEEGHPESNARAWVNKFFALWCRNQWKRDRFAPGIHLDDENLDPRTWCRFPLLSGGFPPI